MHEKTTIQIPSGFQVICVRESYDILDAGNVLHTKKRYKYTSASRSGETAVLQYHRIRCPFCGWEIPAYPQYQADSFPFDRKPIPREMVDAWANPQYSFFENEDAVIDLSPVTLPKTTHLCPKCGRHSAADRGSTEVSVSSRRKKVAVSCRAGTKYVLDLMQRTRSSGHLQFPLTESLTFDLGRGRIYLTVRNCDGSPVLIRDITYARELWNQSETYRVIRDSHLLRRVLNRHFVRIWGDRLPFSPGELSPETFCAMTQFVGYPKVFYDTIPIRLADGNLDRSFVAVSRRMRNAGNLDRIYRHASLPPMKSVRRIFFREPGYFFYLPEAQLLWQVFGDPNHYVSLFSLPRIYDLLSKIRQYPGISCFLRDYQQVRGSQKLLTALRRRPDAIQEYALRYSAMSPRVRKQEQRNWSEKTVPTGKQAPYSIPMQTGSFRIPDCRVEGYSFTWLRTRRDYMLAGQALHNCLVDWQPENNPVVAVKKGDACLAAIEVRGDFVVQVRGIRNAPILKDSQLHKAIDIWEQRHGLTPLEFPDDDEEEELLFF